MLRHGCNVVIFWAWLVGRTVDITTHPFRWNHSQVMTESVLVKWVTGPTIRTGWPSLLILPSTLSWVEPLCGTYSR